MVRAQQLVLEIEEGEWEEALSALSLHRASLRAKPPALETVLAAVVHNMLPGETKLAGYAGRLLYAFKVEDTLEPALLSPSNEQRVLDTARESLVSILSRGSGADSLRERAAAGVADGLLSVIHAEAAERVLARTPAWIDEHWLRAHELGYFFEQAGLEVTMPSREALMQAFSGYRTLIESDSEAQLLQIKIPKQLILPQLLAQSWPQALSAIEQAIEVEPLLANRRSLGDMATEARRIADAGGAHSR